MFADLHLHTNFSDGTFTPEELAAHGKAHGLAAMALTDHDTVEGCARMAAACAAEGIEFISGTELTAELDGIEVHLLGYCMDLDNEKLLSRSRPVPGRAPEPHSRNGRAAQRAECAAAGRGRVRACQLPLARPAARGPRAGARPVFAAAWMRRSNVF